MGLFANGYILAAFAIAFATLGAMTGFAMLRLRSAQTRLNGAERRDGRR
jgi:hypothetical protein